MVNCCASFWKQCGNRSLLGKGKCWGCCGSGVYCWEGESLVFLDKEKGGFETAKPRSAANTFEASNYQSKQRDET
jgi:hypothetical protein